MKRNWALTIILLALTLALSVSEGALAFDDGTRSKVIDFEDELVEGVNKKPYDSLSHISDGKNKNKRAHLYRKRGGFRSEIKETLLETRIAQ